MKNFIFLLVSIFIVACTKAQTKYNDYPIKAVKIQNVVLTDSFWLPKIKVIQDLPFLMLLINVQRKGEWKVFLSRGE